MRQLLARTAELVDVSSLSFHEQALADLVESELRQRPRLEVTRIGDNVVARTAHGVSRRIILAGHLDTVPANDNDFARVVGDACWGLGSADMKGGLAVLLQLAGDLDRSNCEVTLVFYAREEVARRHSGLLEVEQYRPDLLAADAALLLEPTGGYVEAGCQGVLRCEAVVTGEMRAHSARPWTGQNAIHRVAPLLERVAGFVERRPVLDGCEFRESLQAVAISGGVAGNVVPDEVTISISHRFAPDRSPVEAFALLVDYLAPALDDSLGDHLELIESAAAAPPALAVPFIAEVVGASARVPRAKLGWTDVAFFSERGIPAANFGPGDPLLAHHKEEHVAADELNHVYTTLAGICGIAPTAVP